MQRKHTISMIAGVIALVIVAATASAYVTRDVMTPEKPKEIATVTQHTAKKEQINWNKPAPQRVVAQPVKTCDDGNIVGTALGGVAGGVAGSQFGKGHGKTATTIGGTLGGAYVGNQFIPTRNVTCR